MASHTAAATVVSTGATTGTAPVPLKRILVALDQSDFANQALRQAVRLGKSAGGTITGIHAYAAKLHDRRFKQMEGGLPERYQYEKEMEHQREVHEDLIGKGLGIITDSYHDSAAAHCAANDLPFKRLSPEGKNYRCIVDALNSGEFDVLALGALGLGAVAGSTIGTVCERVVRRSPIDVLVTKDRRREIGDGPIVVGMDGSEQSFGALKTALDIARRLDVPVHVVAAYDPYYHYVAFNKIAGVLSDEAGKVFRFKEQEQLHEELIDDGIAKIYQAHLNVAESVAASEGMQIVSNLIAGKPHQAIKKYLEKIDASLLVIGKLGVHTDATLDIGGNTENLLRSAPCHVWIGQATHHPPIDVIAEETIMWSQEAEEKIGRAPEFVQGIARTSVIREAHAAGHTFITTRFVEEVMNKLMPAGAAADERMKQRVQTQFEHLDWSGEALALLDTVEDTGLAENIRLRAEKAALRDAASQVCAEHVQPFVCDAISDVAMATITWSAASLARLQRVPEAFRQKAREEIESYARSIGAEEISGEVEDGGFAAARRLMCTEPEATERPD
ncbi:MAG: universal stress protein [Hyphomicrobiales bacterium]|nr:universal stress protein [Hyphomicrobiales bacterium]